MKPACPRLWEVEALEDDRLCGADRAAFERHLGVCDACRRERAAFDDLRRTMAALPERPASTIEHHRLRSVILREANRQVFSASNGRRRWVLAFAAVVTVAAGAAVVVGVGVALRPKPAAERIEVEPQAPKFDVAAGERAVWHAKTDGSATTVDVVDGTLSFHVPHLERSQRFVVTLPDGELEVRGTRFTVDVVSSETASVRVTEGTVALRTGSDREILLGAGERWTRPAPPAAAASTASAHASKPYVPAPVSAAGQRFDDAMASYRAEDFRRADLEFERFLREYPADSRCEDAAFLRAVLHLRMGDRDGAASLARDYLATYPDGFRRTEARHIIETAR
jgi:hypothetical protein